MLNFTIVVDDNGELKTVQAAELEALSKATYDDLNFALNNILDERVAAAELDRLALDRRWSPKQSR